MKKKYKKSDKFAGYAVVFLVTLWTVLILTRLV